MKITVLVFFVALILILATTQVSGQEAMAVQEHRVKGKLHLLNEATLGRKVNVGGSETKNEAANKGTVSTETKTDDEDEVNPAYKSYSETFTERRYYPVTKNPSKTN